MPKSPSHFIWYELNTSDMDAAAKFYGEVVGWTSTASGQPGQDYRMWSIGGETVGGLMAIPAEAKDMPPGWLGYVDVPDVDASVAAIEAAGGALHVPAWDVPGVGRMAMVADPQGASFYVMAPIGADPSTAFSPGRPGHGGWHELHTTDWKAALEFYRSQLGWGQSEAMDMGPGGTYLMFNAGGDAIGGMMNSPNFPRPMWLYYFGVDNIETAKQRVLKAGGKVLQDPHEVPGGASILQAQDPQGAVFALVGPAS